MFTGWYMWAMSTFMVHLKRILLHLFHCIVNTCALIFCRNAKQMPDDVKSALHTVIQENGHMTSQEADAYLHRLEQTRRYQAETWSWGEGLVIKWRNSSSGCLSFESCIIRWQTKTYCMYLEPNIKSNNRKLKQNTQQNIAVNDLWQQNNLYDTIYK